MRVVVVAMEKNIDGTVSVKLEVSDWAQLEEMSLLHLGPAELTQKETE